MTTNILPSKDTGVSETATQVPGTDEYGVSTRVETYQHSHVIRQAFHVSSNFIAESLAFT